ncbi:hypothetical protein EDY49_25265 [Salmonella enterica]|nr:hypothetical protein [Salmonella enterica]ECL4293110.1 hypothetical protein [Salmonella enterica]EEH2994229.1 hypothetical protein [Salmonella enterica]MEM32112.1 hypothetical protein [Salmonella enterica]
MSIPFASSTTSVFLGWHAQPISLQQVLLTAQILIHDIKQKDPELCAQSSKILKRAVIFK